MIGYWHNALSLLGDKDVEKKKCRNCVWFETFNKREDEHLSHGCKKPGWEGYLKEDTVACIFWSEKELCNGT